MRTSTLPLLTLLFIPFCAGDAASNSSTAALDALVRRQLPSHAGRFVFHIDPQVQVDMKTHSDLDTFTLFDGSDNNIHIECSTRSACARGLYTSVNVCCAAESRYLTEIGKVDIYWTGSRLDRLATEMPPVGNNITRQAIVPWRYHFNTGNAFECRIDASYIRVYDNMVGVGRVGANARLDGSPRDKSSSRMVSCFHAFLTSGWATRAS